MCVWKPIWNPCVLMDSASGSIIKLNMPGDKGHSFQVPFIMLKGLDRRCILVLMGMRIELGLLTV